MTCDARCFALLLALGAALASACGGAERVHHAEGDDGFERGPHGGRWLADGDFGLELSIFEEGVPPEFRAFVSLRGEPVEPGGVELEVSLRRFGGRVDRIRFAPRGDYLLGDRTVDEPHSFDVEVVARAAGREHRFAYASYENRVSLAPDQLEAAGISVLAAGPATIVESVVLYGRVAANEDALAHVVPRFPGVVRSVRKRLGDDVAKGEVLAVIESNESLHPFELRAPLAGTVIAKDLTQGEFASGDRALFEIADLSSVWVDLDVYRRDFTRLRVGQRARIDAGDGSALVEASLGYLSPIGSPNTQSLLARAVLPNPDRAWRPGLFVSAEVEVDAAEAPVSVRREAVQRLRDWDVVFVASGNEFEAQPVVLGRSDPTHIEIVSGLLAGQRYVATGSFVLKAEVEKSGATHDH